MTYSIRIKSSYEYNSPWLFEKKFRNGTEFGQFIEQYTNSREQVGFLKSLVIPVRTNTLKNFCQDFLLPTVCNTALNKVNRIERLSLCLVCLILDIATLAIRLFTVIPRCFANAKEPRDHHPLYKYLARTGQNQRLLNTDFVCMEIKYVVPADKAQFPTGMKCSIIPDGASMSNFFSEYKSAQFEEVRTCNFIELPPGPWSHCRSFTGTGISAPPSPVTIEDVTDDRD